MAEYTVLQEWLDRNSHRKFPLNDDATAIDLSGSYTLPDSLLVDLFLAVPIGFDTDKFFVSQVIATSNSIIVKISYDDSGTSVLVGQFEEISRTDERYSTYSFIPSTQTNVSYLPLTKVNGVLIIGRTTDVVSGSWSFSSDTASILSTRVTQGLAVTQTILVGSTLFTGNVAFKEGTNIKLTPSYDATTDTTIITISNNSGTISDTTVPIVDDTTILQNLVNTFGEPIVTINNIGPDSNNNFTISPDDCSELTNITNGVSISNPCARPCCDKSYLQTTFDSISELNIRYSRMESYYQDLSRNVNEIQSRLITLEL